MQQREGAFWGLASALRLCLVQNSDRAERIVCMSHDDYRRDAPPGDADEWADWAFDEDLARAKDVLAWRAVVVASIIGKAVCDVWGDEFLDPWNDWLTGEPVTDGGRLIGGLSDEDNPRLGLAHKIRMTLRLDRLPRNVPTDGDIEGVPGFFDTVRCQTWPEWLEVLGEPPKQVRCLNLLRLAKAAAQRDLPTPPPDSAQDPGSRFSDLTDRLDSIAATQIPTIDLLERMTTQLDRVAGLSPFAVEEDLKGLLGERVYPALHPDARTCLVDAERRFQEARTTDWNSVLASYAKAFERQLIQCLLPALAKHLKERGIPCFPRRTAHPPRNLRRRLLEMAV